MALNRALARGQNYESGGQEFESLRARHYLALVSVQKISPFYGFCKDVAAHGARAQRARRLRHQDDADGKTHARDSKIAGGYERTIRVGFGGSKCLRTSELKTSVLCSGPTNHSQMILRKPSSPATVIAGPLRSLVQCRSVSISSLRRSRHFLRAVRFGFRFSRWLGVLELIDQHRSCDLRVSLTSYGNFNLARLLGLGLFRGFALSVPARLRPS
jgi:hypothetical protein